MRMLLSLFLSYFFALGTVNGADHEVTLSKQDTELLNKVSMFHMAEINMATYALTLNLTNEDKNYARRVMKAHQESQHQLSALGADKQFSMPSTLPKVVREHIEQLKNKETDNFRAEYISWTITSHEQGLDDCEKLSAYSKDEDVRRYANETIVMIRQHIQMAHLLR